jgi:N-acetylmuramoyl-L-alanine amidase
VVVIDPGHGGSNTGTRSAASERSEKYFTLDWALRVAPLLEAKGWRVWLTRTNDVDVGLTNRVAFADDHHADLFVSLHFNSAGVH